MVVMTPVAFMAAMTPVALMAAMDLVVMLLVRGGMTVPLML